MSIINITVPNIAVSIPSGNDAVLGSAVYNDTISLAGNDTLHGGADTNSNIINSSGNNEINVINATINETAGANDTINGRGSFDEITLNGTAYSGLVSLISIDSSGNSITAPIGYGVVLASGASNDTVTIYGGDTVHGGSDLNSNTVNTFGNNEINIAGPVTLNETGGSNLINGRNITFNDITLNGNGNNTVYGGEGSLVTDSGSGNDIIYAQSLNGEHRIYLGTGNDTVAIRDGVVGPQVPGNLDTITVYNFVPGHDVVALTNVGGVQLVNASNIANIMTNAFGYHGQYTELVLGGMSIIFQGVNYSSLHASDFILA